MPSDKMTQTLVFFFNFPLNQIFWTIIPLTHTISFTSSSSSFILEHHTTKKQFPGMIPSSRSLRPQSSRPSVIYNEKLLDRLLDSHLPSPSSCRRNRANDLTTESLIVAAVGFPIDSLTEEEIESNVIPIIGNAQSHSNYITIRNHILTLFRSDPSAFLTETQSAASTRAEHRALVSKAYDFLNSHAYINFGLLPVPKAPLLTLEWL